MQYLTKESPFYQTKIAIKPKGTYRDVDGVVKDEDNKDEGYPIPAKKNKLKEQYRKKTGPTGIAPEKQKFVPTKGTEATPLNQSKKPITVGENTGEVKEDKKGKYVLRSERSVAGAKGDTIRIPNNKLIQDGYLIGGDYETKKLGDKSFEITKQK